MASEQPITPGFAKNEWQLRKEIVAHCRALNERGLNRGTSGNVSARCGSGLLISPSSFPYDLMQAEHIVPMHFDGSYEGRQKPSSEWRFHLDILEARPELQAVIHAHPIYCTTIAILGLDIPSLHYMIAVTGADSVRCAPYATFGTAELSHNAVEALGQSNACLLANHGVIVTGGNLAGALWLLEEVETLAHQYFNTLQLGGPKLLSAEQMEDVRKAMTGGYGRARARSSGSGSS